MCEESMYTCSDGYVRRGGVARKERESEIVMRREDDA